MFPPFLCACTGSLRGDHGTHSAMHGVNTTSGAQIRVTTVLYGHSAPASVAKGSKHGKIVAFFGE